MTVSRVDEAPIINYVRGHGVMAPPTSPEIIWMQQNGVSASHLCHADHASAAASRGSRRPAAAPGCGRGLLLRPVPSPLLLLLA